MDSDHLALAPTEWIAFGSFVLYVQQRTLTRDGKLVALNPRELELLIALIERAGEVITKEELIERVWQDRTVAEVNLRVAVNALRRSLAVPGAGQPLILNSVGRGYAFTRDVRLEYWPRRTKAPSQTEPGSAPPPQGRLPQLLKPVIGRENVVERIRAQLERGRFVTVVGPPGIGKTTVAILAASKSGGIFDDVRFTDFAPARDPNIVLARIAACMSLDQVGGDPLQVIANAVGDKRLLIVLDNCEHVLAAVADAALTILQNVPGVKILATSREPLRLDGEAIFRLEGLAYPAGPIHGGAAHALGFAAVQLLVERVQAARPDFVLEDSLAEPAAEICRRLDGIALAIQLAAGRVATFGLFEVASRLDDRFRFLNHGAHTTLPRHQTLDAAVSWSFDLLDAKERLVCLRLAIFSGEFTLDAAIDVAGWGPIQTHEAVNCLASLVEKSLIAFVAGSDRPRYVYLETIRDFARDKLDLVGGDQPLLKTLAQRLIADCAQFTALIRIGELSETTAFARHRLDDIRFTVGRAFEIGDTAFLSTLLVTFAPMMFHLGAIFELTDWMQRALETVGNPPERLQLLMPYARALGLSRPDLVAQVSLYEEAVTIAETLDDRDSEMRARWGLSYGNGPNYPAQKSFEAAQAFEIRARQLGDRSATFVAESLKARSLHDLGKFEQSFAAHRHVVDHYPSDMSAADANRFGLNHRAISMCDLSELSWQIGELEHAEAWNLAAIAESGDHLPTLFMPISQHICRTIWEGTDWAKVAQQFEMITQRFNVDGRWKTWIKNLGAIIEIQQHGTQSAFANLDQNILAGRWAALNDRYLWIVVHCIQCCMTLGKIELALNLVDQLIPELERRQTPWMTPEALHLKAIALASTGNPDSARFFEAALASAASLGARNFARHIEYSREAFGS